MKSLSLKITAVNRLKESSVFSKKPLYIQILNYLIESEKKGVTVKSSMIAIDLLGQDGLNSSNQDATIRSKVQNIRKDLDLFYLTEGKGEVQRLFIPKGSYKLELEDQKRISETIPNTTQFSKKGKASIAILSVTALLAIVLNVYFILRIPESGITGHNTSLISLFLDKTKPLDIVVGDRGFYTEYDVELGRSRFIYDHDRDMPHTASKLRRHMLKYPERRIFPEIVFYHCDIENMLLAANIKEEWALNGLEVEIIQSSKKKVIQKNTVFISKASSGDLYNLSYYFSESRARLGLLKDEYGEIFTYFLAEDSIPLGISEEFCDDVSRKCKISYCIIKKVITETGHELLFLLPTDDAARNYMLNKLSNLSFREDILSSFNGSIPCKI